MYVENQNSEPIPSHVVTRASQTVPLRPNGLRATTCVVVLTSVVCARAFAIDTDRNIRQLYHTSWTAKDGAPTQMAGIARTRDGYLWLGSQLGLFRFNGLRFEAYIPPPGISFPSAGILNVYGTRDGGLWVSFASSGAAYIKETNVEVFDQPGLELHSFVEDLDGRVWATTITTLRYFDGTTWKQFEDPTLVGKRIWNVFCDRSGGIWVATDKGINFLPRMGNSFQQIGPPSNVQQIGESPGGEMWMADWSGHIRPAFSNPRKGPLIELRIGASFFFESDGSLWFLTDGKGIGRLRPRSDNAEPRGALNRSIEWFTSKDGLTGDFVINTSLQDAEGNIWIATDRGLDRFRHSTFAPVKMSRAAQQFTLQAAEGGGIWVGSSTVPIPISLIREEEVLFEGPRARVSSVCRDSEGIIWWGVQGGLWRQEGKRFLFYPQPKNLPFDWIWEVLPDNDTGGLWVGMGDSGLMYFKGGTWSNTHKPQGLPDTTPSATFHENERRIWFGYHDNRAAKLSGGKVELYTSSDGLDVGRIRAIRGTKGLVWFGGEAGLQVLRDRHFTHVRATDSMPIEKVTGIVEASDGSLWLNEIHGLLRVSPADIEQISKNPNHLVSPRRFDVLDGLPGAGQMYVRSSTLLESSDRRIWVATDGGLAWTDPSKEQVNTFEPPVLITGVHTKARDYSYVKEVELPAGTTAVRFSYEALSLSIPERVRFKYILKGVDDYWKDADTRRDATYNNLSPGHYQFIVAASDAYGEWNSMNKSVQLSILPLFYQTLWFRTLVVLVFAMLVWMFLLVRIRQANERIEARLGERLMERERIARELHDTLLQGFQMLVLRFQVIADTMSPGSPARKLLEDSLSRAERTLQEARDKVGTLRSGTEPAKDLALELAQFGRELSGENLTAFQFTVEGNPRPIQPVVCEEIQMIAREAIANSFRHAAATSIECVIQFTAGRFSFVCRDNGCGIPENVLETKNKNGHWGLVNMEERARKIGGVLRISRGATCGTKVELKLRAGIAYVHVRSSFWGLLRRGQQ